MSKTVRRKNYVPTWVKNELEMVRATGSWYYRKVPLEGVGLKKSLCRYHSDVGCVSRTNPSKWFRQEEQRRHRAQCRQEIVKYMKNDEYECMIISNPKLPYWD